MLNLKDGELIGGCLRARTVLAVPAEALPTSAMCSLQLGQKFPCAINYTVREAG